jgi:hypothetical protein
VEQDVKSIDDNDTLSVHANRSVNDKNSVLIATRDVSQPLSNDEQRQGVPRAVAR